MRCCGAKSCGASSHERRAPNSCNRAAPSRSPKKRPAAWAYHSAGFAIRSPRGVGEPHDINLGVHSNLSCILICSAGGRPQAVVGGALELCRMHVSSALRKGTGAGATSFRARFSRGYSVSGPRRGSGSERACPTVGRLNPAANIPAKRLVLTLGGVGRHCAADDQSAYASTFLRPSKWPCRWRGELRFDLASGEARHLQSRELEGMGFGQLGRRRPLAGHGCPLQLLQFARFARLL